MLVTRMLRDSRIAASEAAAIPFPRLETTPPVTNTYLVIYAKLSVKAGVYRNRLCLTNAESALAHKLHAVLWITYIATWKSHAVFSLTRSCYTLGCSNFSHRPIDGTTSKTHRSVKYQLTSPLPV